MSDFLKYWDTRIDANERFFNNYPHIANFAFSEAQLLHEHMKEEIDTLRAQLAETDRRRVALENTASAVAEWWKHRDTHCEVIPAPMLLDRMAALVGEEGR